MQHEKLNKAQVNKLEQQVTQSAIAVMTMPGQSIENLATEFAVMDHNFRAAMTDSLRHLQLADDLLSVLEIPEDNVAAQHMAAHFKKLVGSMAQSAKGASEAAQQLDAVKAIDAVLTGEGQKSGLIMPGQGLH